MTTISRNLIQAFDSLAITHEHQHHQVNCIFKAKSHKQLRKKNPQVHFFTRGYDSCFHFPKLMSWWRYWNFYRGYKILKGLSAVGFLTFSFLMNQQKSSWGSPLPLPPRNSTPILLVNLEFCHSTVHSRNTFYSTYLSSLLVNELHLISDDLCKTK